MLFPPRFLPHILRTCRKTGSGNRATCSARQRQRQRKRQRPPHVQCMYEIYVSCLGRRAGLGWLGSHVHNENDNNTTYTEQIAKLVMRAFWLYRAGRGMRRPCPDGG